MAADTRDSAVEQSAGPEMRRRRVVRPAAFVLATLVGAFVISTIPGVRSEPGFNPIIDGWLQAVAYAACAAVCLLRPLLSPVRRRAWAFIAAGLTLRATGFIVFLGFVRTQTPQPYPSLADAAWLASAICLAIGLVDLARDATGRLSVGIVLDALIGAIACAALTVAVLWTTIVGLAASTLPRLEIAVNLAYPIADLALLVILLGVLTRQAWRPPPVVWVMSAGVALLAIADAAFVYESAAGTFRPGTLLPALSLVATALIALSPWAFPPPASGVPPRDPGAGTPTVAGIAAVALLSIGAIDHLPPGAVLLACIALGLIAVRMIVTFRELRQVTARLREQEQLRRSTEARAVAEAERMSVVLDGIPDYAIIGATLKDGVTVFSRGAERMLGYSAEEVVGRVGPEVFHLESELEERAAQLGVARTDPALYGSGEASRWTYVRKDGSTLPVALSLTGLGPVDGVPSDFVAVARDISREQELERFRATREALEPLLADAPTIDAALRGAVRTATEGMGWAIGALWLPDDDTTDRSLRCRELWQRDDVASDELSAAFASLRMAPEEGDGAVGQSWQDGVTVWIEDFTQVREVTGPAARLRDSLVTLASTTALVPIGGARPADPPIGVLQFFGARQARSDAVVQLLETIANTIGRHLEQVRSADELRAARDEAEAANAAKSQFVSRISHELRTPLNAIMGHAQLLRRDAQQQRQQTRADRILTAGRHLTEMIDDLLDLAWVERGEMRVSIEAVSATHVLQEVVELMSPLIAERELDLAIDAHEGLYRFVAADFQRLRQVLLNLVSNAVKYNRPGGAIRVSFEAVGEERLHFVVQDTGAGIAPAEQARLFQPFERLGAETGPEQGTGLGLVLSKGLVEAMGGHLRVVSEAGVGSTFVVDLAQAPIPTDAGRSPTKAPNDAWPETPWPASTVLYIEDNPTNITVVEDLCTTQPSTQLITAMTGETGLRMAIEHEPDVILLDVHLPDIDGWEVLERLRADERTARIPIVVVSAESSTGMRRRFLEGGAQRYLTKPLDLLELVRTVSDLLRRESPAEVKSPGAPGDD